MTAPTLEPFDEFVKRKKSSKIKEIKFYHNSRKGHWIAQVEDIVFVPQHNYPDKMLTLEILKFTRFEGDIPAGELGQIQYRLGYYIRSKKDENSSRYNQWTWGQYSPIIPAVDLKQLFELAKEKGHTII